MQLLITALLFLRGATGFQPGVTGSGEKVCVVGATGYIGKFVVQECVRRGYPTTAVVRKKTIDSPYFEGASVLTAPATSKECLMEALSPSPPEVVICCLASRTGSKSDSMLVDYEASVNALNVARELKARHFILLSAFCVAKPWLAFQDAKLLTEKAMADQDDVTYSIVRPTAYFKSVSGQLNNVRQGNPYMFFDLGNKRTARCNPIAESDLAKAIVDCVVDPSKNSKTGNPIWNVGGPEDFDSIEQGNLMADAISKVRRTPRQELKTVGVPVVVFDVVIGFFQLLAAIFKSEQFEDAAEFGKIVKYYAVEDMLTTSSYDKYGTVSLFEHYKVAVGKEEEECENPYTTVDIGDNVPQGNARAYLLLKRGLQRW